MVIARAYIAGWFVGTRTKAWSFEAFTELHYLFVVKIGLRQMVIARAYIAGWFVGTRTKACDDGKMIRIEKIVE